jgi:glycosyltransferase involved in cell wall biosynthesis
MQNIKIAVVVPVYNGELTILKSLKSLENQIFKDWIAIIINDGSTDKTLNLIAGLNTEKHIVINLDKNQGRGAARQIGLEKIRELEIPFMCMLDADDLYCPNKLQEQYVFMNSNAEVTLFSTAIGVTNKNKDLISVLRPYSKQMHFYCTAYNNFIQVPHACSIIRVKDCEGIEYDSNMKFSEDLDFMRRLLLNKKYAFSPEITYIYNREDSFSFEKYKNATYFNILSFNKLPVSISAKCLYALKSYAKLLIVSTLTLLNLEKYYLNNIGVQPTKLDLQNITKQ